jgi:hypothetical protein
MVLHHVFYFMVLQHVAGHNVLQTLDAMRQDLWKQLSSAGLALAKDRSNVNEENKELLKAIIMAGM